MLQREETDFDFFSRRAMEEARSATRAGSRRASSVHRHMAVAYAVRMRDEQLAAQALAEMLELLTDAGDASTPVANRAPLTGTTDAEAGTTG